MTKTVVLYHRGCNDGTASAAMCLEYGYPDADYFPYQYGDELPVEVEGSHLILLDLSLKEDKIKETLQRVESILIIDHHATAKPLTEKLIPVRTHAEYLEYLTKQSDLPKAYILYQDKVCGAVLTWAFFNSIATVKGMQEFMPAGLELINDYDLWQHRLADTKPFNAFIIKSGVTPHSFRSMVSDTSSWKPADQVLSVGKAYLAYDNNIIRGVTRSYIQHGWVDLRQAAFINAPHHLRNEVADRILAEHEWAAVVVCYTIRHDKIVVSLRSRDYPVSRVAERFGGGGHAKAAAYTIPVGPLDHFRRNSLVNKPTFGERVVMAWKLLIGKY